MKKWLSLGLSVAFVASMLAGTVTASAAAKGEKPYVAVIAKGFQSQYWQVVKKGADDAAAKLGVNITFDGPDSESNIQQQVDMINADIAKKPKALALAVLDTKSVTSQLQSCKDANIPVIGFDSGVPGDASGALVATAATNNSNAAALAADKMFENAKFKAAVQKGTKATPVVIGVLSQDATSASITQRTSGFINEMLAKLNTVSSLKNAVKVQGQQNYNKASKNPAKVIIQVNVPPSTSATDLENGAQALLRIKNLVALFASNQTTADGVLAATNDGSDLDRSSGKFKNLLVAGFDAGKGQKAAVKNKWFIGSVTQDPYTIGYKAVSLALDAINGKKVKDADTGAKWYNSSNMAEPSIAQLLYD